MPRNIEKVVPVKDTVGATSTCLAANQSARAEVRTLGSIGFEKMGSAYHPGPD
jgi:hypothetical protein